MCANPNAGCRCHTFPATYGLTSRGAPTGISASIAFQHPFNRAGGRTFNVGQKNIMNLFKKLFEGDQSPSKPSPREIVYDFADVLGQLNLPILDARLLPHPKAE